MKNSISYLVYRISCLMNGEDRGLFRVAREL